LAKGMSTISRTCSKMQKHPIKACLKNKLITILLMNSWFKIGQKSYLLDRRNRNILMFSQKIEGIQKPVPRYQRWIESVSLRNSIKVKISQLKFLQ
jgi:hypothetical protein